jgi:hypothetical protein
MSASRQVGCGASHGNPGIPSLAARTTPSRAVSANGRAVCHLQLGLVMRKGRFPGASTRGFSVLESMLVICALLFCFLYAATPSLRRTGANLADQADRGPDAMLQQTQ